MNPFYLAAVALCAGLAGCGWVLARADVMSCLVALEMAGALTTTTLMLISQASGEAYLYDLALGLALLSFPTALTFAHFLERSG